MAGGYAWQGEVCVAEVACMFGGHAWQGTCVVGGHAWWECMHSRGACMAGDMRGRGCVWQERGPLKLAVRILLECILVG